MTELTIRPAFPNDAAALRRLAQLDSATVPAGELLLAELCGEPVAAVPLRGGRAIADPFRPTAAIVELLARRAEQLRAGERPRPASRRAPLLRPWRSHRASAS